jgi:hypothetical protein
MGKEDIEMKLGGMGVPAPGNIGHQQELKIPLLSYRRSSKAGLWLLLLPLFVAIVVVLKHEFGLGSPVLDAIKHSLNAVDGNPVFTLLIPVVAVGLPFLVMTMNLLAICHFTYVKEKKELLITLKIRLFNIALVLSSCAILIYFLLPDRLSF